MYSHAHTSTDGIAAHHKPVISISVAGMVFCFCF